MNQLIRITTVPIQYELKVNNARLEYSRAKAELEISRNDGGLSIKLNLDATEARNSVVPTTARSVAQTAQAGKEAAYSATAQLVQEGKSIIVVSSEMPELFGVCDRIMVMSNGNQSGIFNAKEATQFEIMEASAKYI